MIIACIAVIRGSSIVEESCEMMSIRVTRRESIRPGGRGGGLRGDREGEDRADWALDLEGILDIADAAAKYIAVSNPLGGGGFLFRS
jgi:hypothetical protein